jgi:hypothetical protein
MATPERRRGRTGNMRVFDGGIKQPIPLITEGSHSHGGYSLFPSRQRIGNASTPPALVSRSEPEHPEAKARLDSAALPASEAHQAEHPRAKSYLDSADLPASVNNRVSTLYSLEEDINRDSASYVPGKKPTPGTNSSGQSNAKAVPADRFKSHNDTSANSDVSPSILDQPAIPSPPPSTIGSQPASHNRPPAQSLRSSRNLKCRPTSANGPQGSQASGIVAVANSLSSRGYGSLVVDGVGSSIATRSPSPPPVSPCDLGGEGT